jgi:sterol desaturase/sphingolipid hydroxylase (fatty acid hydroxylase superfamily)
MLLGGMRVSTLIAASTSPGDPCNKGLYCMPRYRLSLSLDWFSDGSDAQTVSSIYVPKDHPGQPNLTEKTTDARRKSAAAMIGLLIVSFASYVGGVLLLCAIVKHWPGLGPFVFIDTHGKDSFELWSAALQPGALLAVLAFCFAIEAGCIGFERSALNRLFSGESASARVDLFYIALRMTGGINVLAFAFSFGTLFWLTNHIHRVLHVAILNHVHSYIVQFAIVYLINTFLAYWGHRFMHTRLMWEIHKVHHAAEEMNLVTSIRNHPIDQAIMTLINAFSVALLGAAPAVVILYYAVNTVYQLLVHSEITLKGKLWDKIWITPAAHRVHHSNRVDHWDRNFGVLALWDHVFGTYHPPIGQKLTYGVEGGEAFNRPEHCAELLDNVRRWLRPVWSALIAEKSNGEASPGRPASDSTALSSPAEKPVRVEGGLVGTDMPSGNPATLTPA